MTINRSTLLDLPLPVTGTEDGTWGDVTNNGLTEYLDIAIAGMTSLTSSDFTANELTLALTEGTNTATNIVGSSAQYSAIRVSSLAANSTITAPSSNRAYKIINADSTYSLTVKASGQTGVTFLPGTAGWVAFNGTDYFILGVVGPASATDNAVARFDGTTGKIVQNSAVTIADTSGNITGGTYNKVTITAPATGSTLTIADGKTLTANNSLTLGGTDATTMTFPSTSATIARTDAGQTFTGAQTFSTAIATGSGGTGQSTYSNGQLLIGKNDGTLAKATLTAGSNIVITNGDGSITIESTGGGGGGGGTSVTVTQVTATGGQTTFNVTYTVGQLSVYLNGALLASADFTATNGTTVVLAAGAAANDIFTAVAYNSATQIIQGDTKVEVTDTGSNGKITGTADNTAVFSVEKGKTFVLQGGVSSTGVGIAFPADQTTVGASTNANTLDDYEEGTFTPIDGSLDNLTFTSASGSYRKVGGLVILFIDVTYPSTASANSAFIAGFPIPIITYGGGFVSGSSSGLNLNFRFNTATSTHISSGGSFTSVTNAQLSLKQVQFIFIQMAD
jgi:hypothetical protein